MDNVPSVLSRSTASLRQLSSGAVEQSRTFTEHTPRCLPGIPQCHPMVLRCTLTQLWCHPQLPRYCTPIFPSVFPPTAMPPAGCLSVTKAASLLPQLLPSQLPQCSTHLTKVYPQDVSVSFLTATVSCRLPQCPHPTLTLCPPKSVDPRRPCNSSGLSQCPTPNALLSPMTAALVFTSC